MVSKMGGKRVSARVTAYLAPDKAKFLEQWAASENRTVSNLAATILLAAIEEKVVSEKRDES